MDYAVYMFVAFGLCFALQHKVLFLHGKFGWLDALLHCTFCTGFHCGWMTWLLVCGAKGEFPPMNWTLPFALATWCLASAAVCYCLDTLTTWLEAKGDAS